MRRVRWRFFSFLFTFLYNAHRRLLGRQWRLYGNYRVGLLHWLAYKLTRPMRYCGRRAIELSDEDFSWVPRTLGQSDMFDYGEITPRADDREDELRAEVPRLMDAYAQRSETDEVPAKQPGIWERDEC